MAITEDTPIQNGYKIPNEFASLFWSEWPTQKTTKDHGAAIAYRMFMYGGDKAWNWAITHVNKPDLINAINGRGMRSDAKLYVMGKLGNLYA
jgi:hypothetical protein